MSKMGTYDDALQSSGGWIVYILECSDGSYYTGITNDLDRRVQEHNEGGASRYTRSRRPVTPCYHETCENKSAALIRECAVKLMSHKEKKALIDRASESKTG